MGEGERNMALSWGDGVLLLNFPPVVVGLSEFELKEIVGELNKLIRKKRLPSG